MLEDRPAGPDAEAGAAEPRPQARTHAALGPAAARLCEAVEEGDVLAIVCGEQRGEALARAAAAMTDVEVVWLPPPDTLPGEAAPSSPAVAGRRVAALQALRRRQGRVLLLTDAAGALHLTAAPDVFSAHPLEIADGDAIDSEGLAARLEAIGYFRDDRVDEAGEFAVRGGAIDIFPADREEPVRIHLNEAGAVEEIVAYDPVSQLGRSERLRRIAIEPAAEPEPGEGGAALFDWLPEAAVALDPETADRRDSFLELAKESGRAKAPLLTAAAWEKAIGARKVLDLSAGEEREGRRFVQERRPERAFAAMLRQARERGDRVLIAGSSRDLRFIARRLEKALGEAPEPVSRWREVRAAEPGALLSCQVELERGWTAEGVSVVAGADLLGSRAASARGGGSANPLAQEVADFHVGDAIIHEDHGLALLRGLETVAAGETEGDAFRLEHAGEAQRLVPAEEGARLWRYGAEAEAVTLDRVDGSSWEKRRAEIDRTIAETARQLIALARERETQTAPVLEPPVTDYERFAAGFPYAETPDQLRAIEAVRADLASGRPMDRLVVGDVGYGKTEVALRAVAVAALAGRQVALVAPTTVLVRQHVESFRRRFRRAGIEVAGLSRLDSAPEARAVKKGLADGSIRIVVGTKMLAGKTVQFQDLGLVIVDEEQRFGAADKAKLRAMGGASHVLTLTATPIPRTLQSALVGLQELSLITTPPARRLPTRTEVASFAPETVKGALLRERRRGGQSFIVVPRIEDMEPMAERLAKLVPQLSVRRAHGKMPAAEVDEEMVRFAAGDGDVLLATNIIEAGLDIPRANTMIVWRADRFGLAQLHQLRGRVGRGRSRGYVVLMTEADAQIASATLKRLRTMEALDQLGAGFAISARDLDLRGAGELLGEEQAGHMKLIGVGLYQHLLEQAIRAARGEDVDDWLPELRLGLSGGIPEEWVPEEDVRINLYVRVARLASAAEADSLADEMEDRFGTLPEEAARLLEVARIRRLAREARIARVDAGPAAMALTPRHDFAGEAAGAEWKGERLLFKVPSETDAERLMLVRELLERLIPES